MASSPDQHTQGQPTPAPTDRAAEIFARALREHQSGNAPSAEQLYRQVLAKHPDHAQSLHMLGVAVFQQGRAQEAIANLTRALSLEPDLAEAHSNLGCVLASLKRRDEAIAAFQRAVEIRPDYPEAVKNLRSLRAGGRDPGEVLRKLEAALAKDPTADAHNRLAGELIRQGLWPRAAELLREAVALFPDNATSWIRYADSLRETGRTEESVPAAERAVALAPDNYLGWNSLGASLYRLGRAKQAVAAYDRAMALMPKSAEVHFNRSLAVMLLGDYRQGWREYEWGLTVNSARLPKRRFDKPVWDGKPTPGRILLHGEQGFGDAIQYARFIRHAAQRCGTIFLECFTPLTRLFTTLEHVAQVIPAGEPLPPFDAYCSLLSLPAVLGLDERDIPVAAPYLHADAGETAKWRSRLNDGGPRRVGLVWATRHDVSGVAFMGMGPHWLEPLLDVPNVRLYSLQVGADARRLSELPAGAVTDLSPHINDFADTAAAMSCMDLIISVDTAAAHLAGAMGLAVWTLLSRTEWRWGLDRGDTPWYPTMRLFRNSTGNPQDVIRDMVNALRDFAAVRHP